MQSFFSPRLVLALIGLACVALLSFAWYMQYGPGQQQPCPLCVLQRYAYLALAIVCLIAAAHGPQRMGMLIYAGVADLLATTGIGLAFWQVTKGASMTSCATDPIGVFVNNLPMANWWPEYLFASGGCGDRYPPMLGMHTPQWSLLWFAVFATAIALSVIPAFRRRSFA